MMFPVSVSGIDVPVYNDFNIPTNSTNIRLWVLFFSNCFLFGLAIFVFSRCFLSLYIIFSLLSI